MHVSVITLLAGVYNRVFQMTPLEPGLNKRPSQNKLARGRIHPRLAGQPPLSKHRPSRVEENSASAAHSGRSSCSNKVRRGRSKVRDHRPQPAAGGGLRTLLLKWCNQTVPCHLYLAKPWWLSWHLCEHSFGRWDLQPQLRLCRGKTRAGGVMLTPNVISVQRSDGRFKVRFGRAPSVKRSTHGDCYYESNAGKCCTKCCFDFENNGQWLNPLICGWNGTSG